MRLGARKYSGREKILGDYTLYFIFTKSETARAQKGMSFSVIGGKKCNIIEIVATKIESGTKILVD